MQLGKTLLGAIIGAAVGFGLWLAVYLTLGIDGGWLAIPFAAITGLGVRTLASTSGHASYVRGALTMVLALAAYIGGWYLMAKIATARANAPRNVAHVAAGEKSAEPGGDEAKDADATAKEGAAPAAPPIAPARTADMQRPQVTVPRTMGSTWDIIWLAVAALIAYEFGRGSGMVPAGQPMESMPGSTHPDA